MCEGESMPHDGLEHASECKWGNGVMMGEGTCMVERCKGVEEKGHASSTWVAGGQARQHAWKLG